MKITIQIKSVYGNETIYPVCAKALQFAKMLNQKTLTKRDLQNIQELGFEIELKNAYSL